MGKISGVLSYQGHTGVLVRLDVPATNPDGCPATAWYLFPDESAHVQFVQAGLMTAMYSGKAVALTLNGCYQGYPRIIHVYFGKD